MGPWQNLAKRKFTGAKTHVCRKKRKSEAGRPAIETRLGDRKLKMQRVRGGNQKVKLFYDNKVNVVDPKTKKVECVDIVRFVENPASPDFQRRSILTKGAVIETKKGRAKITNRPSQDGMINATLI
ncbi:MAG: 30S ribosomal protein S8e [Promethearchaeota archaeon CR_4]|nr:MAG: 30S ribosomal protein S8e [Candidatus Lokiarchaeota archaeon CR_4]